MKYSTFHSSWSVITRREDGCLEITCTLVLQYSLHSVAFSNFSFSVNYAPLFCFFSTQKYKFIYLFNSANYLATYFEFYKTFKITVGYEVLLYMNQIAGLLHMAVFSNIPNLNFVKSSRITSLCQYTAQFKMLHNKRSVDGTLRSAIREEAMGIYWREKLQILWICVKCS